MSEYFPTKFAMKLAVSCRICDEKTQAYEHHQKMEEIEYKVEKYKEELEEYRDEIEDEEYVDEIMESKIKRLKRKYLRNKNRVDRYDALVEFQNLSVSTDFKSALISFDGIELSEEQIIILEKIHDSTFDWVKGKLADKIITKINTSVSGKEIKDLTDALLIIMNGGSEIGDGMSKRISAYIVNTQ